MKSVKFSIILILIVLLAVSACDIDLSVNDPAEELDVVEEAWNIIHDEYVDSDQLDDQALIEGAIRGMTEAIKDPYTAYLGPEESAISSSELEGDFSGIGAILTVEDEKLTVVSPIANSPAEEAGIRPGDVILKIDGMVTSEMSLVGAVLKIRGEKGTKVVLTVIHPDTDTAVEIGITRAEIELPSVTWEMLPGNIAHISITNFSSRTGDELESALEDAGSQGVAGIALDLRDNPGGLVSAAVDVVSQFVADGLVVYALDNKSERDEWEVKSGGLALDIPLIVLVNKYSASASEVVAGALQDHDRGFIMGTTTYGKGKMNLVNDLSNGGSLYVTFARWFTPHGRQIDEKGITPDIEVEITPEDIENEFDPQLERACEYLRQNA